MGIASDHTTTIQLNIISMGYDFSMISHFLEYWLDCSEICNTYQMFDTISINHFQVIPMDSQTMDITQFADIFHYNLTIKA